MRTTAARLSPLLALFSLLFLTRCTGVIGESGLPGDPISGDGGDSGGGAGARGQGGAIVTGSGGGPGGFAGAAGAGVGAGGAGVPPGLPCEVQALLQSRCITCHASPPVNGAPMPLTNFANLIAASFADSTKTFAQRAVARMQLTTGQMPPAPNLRATAAEVQAMSNWIAAGYPNTGCGTGAGGSTGAGGATGVGGRTGTGGATGTGGRTGTGGAGGATAAGLPCDVQAVYQTHCTTCHAATPVNGAPMPLVTRANLVTASFVDASMTFAQRTAVRMQSTTSPMPPAPGTRATAAEVQTVNTWISAGYPAGTCTVGGTGGAGGTADPLGAAARCTSGTTWTGGNNGNPMMNPGRACISCHAGEEDAPRFTIAGTLYPTGHEPNLCNGVNGTTGARVVIVDAANRTVTLTPNAAGNFMYTGAITTPYHAKVTYQGRERIMPVAQSTGDCNSCHTQTGTNGAPGRITLP